MRCGEDNIELNRAAGKGVVGVASQHIDTLLLSRHYLIIAFRNVAEDSEVNQSTARLIITMYGKDVLAFLEQVRLVAIQTNYNAIDIVHDACSSLLAVDVNLASIVVREDEVEVALKLAGCQVNCSTHPNVVILFRPRCTDVVVVVRTEGTLAVLPCRGVEVGLHPVVGRLYVCVLCLPFGFVCHRDNAFHKSTLSSTHPAIGRAIDIEKTFQRLFVVSPMTRTSVS